jgi:hypothetical protein
MAEQKTYIKGVKLVEKHFENGNSILKISCKADVLIEQLNAMKNGKGYVNFGVSARKEVGQYGDTHCMWLDTWQPKAKDVPTGSSPGSRYSPGNQMTGGSSEPAPESDNLPF